MKENLEQMGLKMIAKVVEKKIKRDIDLWPPICGGILHQPVRPKKK